MSVPSLHSLPIFLSISSILPLSPLSPLPTLLSPSSPPLSSLSLLPSPSTLSPLPSLPPLLSPPFPSLSLPQETDASLLTVTGYPAFAIDDPNLRERTEEKVRTTLAGEKGYKRFLRDSYLTVREGGRKFKEPIGDTSVGNSWLMCA